MSHSDSNQTEHQSEYERAFKAWFKSLPADQQETLKAARCDKPVSEQHGAVSTSDEDPDDRPIKDAGIEMAAHLDCLSDRWVEETRGLNQEQTARWCAMMNKRDVLENSMGMAGSLLAWFAAWQLEDKNPVLRVWAAAFAFGLDVTQGKSGAHVVKSLGVTRAAISRRIIKFKKQYGARSRNMKSDQACEAYRYDKNTNHHRYQEQIERAKENEAIHHDKLD